MVDHAADADRAAISNGEAWQDGGTGTDPDIVANRDRASVLHALIAALGIHRMIGSIQANIGSNEHVIADIDPCPIEDGQVGINMHVVAKMQVEAVFSMKRRGNCNLCAQVTQQRG